MCGIIGITSNKPVSVSIINSLRKLEYRGYDSAGIATLSNGFINEVKSEGRVDKLEKNIDIKNMAGLVGIGHVRWATHGVPNTINAHPHSSENVSVVHNGIIENSVTLKKYLVSKGHKFKSQTDTEVIVHLITELLKENNLKNSILRMLKQLQGSFAIAIIFKDQPDLIVGARRGSPLAVGYGPNENYLGSDSYALKSMTNKITYLDDGDVCILSSNNVEFYNSKSKKINKEVLTLSEDKHTAEKGSYKDFISVWKYIIELNSDFSVLYNKKLGIDNTLLHYPLHYLLVSRFDIFIQNKEFFLKTFFIISIFLPFIFYKCLSIKFQNVEKKYLVFL